MDGSAKDKYGLHAVIIKKASHNLEEAKKVAQDIIKDKSKTFYRETKASYRFRNISKQKFYPKSFRTKKVNKDISLVFGKLKPEWEHLEGSGILDFFKKGVETVKGFFKPRLDDYNNTSKATIQQFGNIPIKNLTIYRTPISSMLNTALNFVSLGKWNELRTKYGFDKLFHLALIADIGGKNIIIEKNEVVNITTSYQTSKDTETQPVDLKGKVFTISEMLETARKNVGDKTFFAYDAFNKGEATNCQGFIKILLEGQGLYTEEAKKFLFQDLEEIYKGLPSYVPKVAKAFTTTGAVVNKLLGKGDEEEDCACGGSRNSGYIAKMIATKQFNISKTKAPMSENAKKIGRKMKESKKFYDERRAETERTAKNILYAVGVYNNKEDYNSMGASGKKEIRDYVKQFIDIKKSKGVDANPEREFYTKIYYNILKDAELTRPFIDRGSKMKGSGIPEEVESVFAKLSKDKATTSFYDYVKKHSKDTNVGLYFIQQMYPKWLRSKEAKAIIAEMASAPAKAPVLEIAEVAEPKKGRKTLTEAERIAKKSEYDKKRHAKKLAEEGKPARKKLTEAERKAKRAEYDAKRRQAKKVEGGRKPVNMVIYDYEDSSDYDSSDFE